MSMTSDLIRGHTDTIILAQLNRGDSYGYKINKALLETTSRQYSMKEATLYTAFRRLEEMGHITSYWGDEQSGARRRYYAITDSGKQHYRLLLKEWCTVREIIDNLVEEDKHHG